MKAMKTMATMKAMPKAKPKAKPELYKAFTGAVRLRRVVLEMKATMIQNVAFSIAFR